MTRSQKPNRQKDLALERIVILFSEAEKNFRSNPERARDYLKQAWKIALRHRVRIPIALKRKICKKCFSYLFPGISEIVRFNKGRIIITCKNCSAVKRVPYKKARKQTL